MTTADAGPGQGVSLPMPRVALLSEQEALKRGRELGIDDYIAKMHLFRVLLQSMTM